MIATQYINLSMVPGGVLPVLHCSQYDVGRPLGVVVHDSVGPVNLDSYTVTVEAMRSDGAAITAEVLTAAEIGYFTTNSTMTNVPDQYPAQLVIVDANGNRVASLPFIMNVVKAAMDENAESIEEDASLYDQYTIAVQTLIATRRSDSTASCSSRRSDSTAGGRHRASEQFDSRNQCPDSTRDIITNAD